MQTAIMLSHSCLFTWLPCLDCSPAHVWFPTKCSGSVPRACLPTRWIEGMFKQCLWPQQLGGATHHLEPGGGSSRCFSGGQDWSGWWWQIQRAEPEIFPPAGGGQHKPGLHFKHLRTQTHTWELSLLQDTLPLLAQLGSGRALQSGLRIAVKRRTQNIENSTPDQRSSVPSNYSPLRRGSFHGGSAEKSLPANAGDTGLILELGRSHMLRSNQAHAQLPSLCSRVQEPQLISLHAATTEVLSRTRVLSRTSHHYEKPANCN